MLLVLPVLMSVLGQPRAAAQGAPSLIYWGTAGGDIRRGTVTGEWDETMIPGPAVGAMAVDSSHGKVYWSDTDTELIKRSDLDGSNVETVVGTDGACYGLAVDEASNRIYWSEMGQGHIHGIDADGTDRALVSDGLSGGPTRLAYHAGYLYFLTVTTVQRVAIGAGGPQVLYSILGSTPDQVGGLALDPAANRIYILQNRGDASGGEILRGDMSGGGSLQTVRDYEFAIPCDGLTIDADGGWLYFGRNQPDGSSHSIRRIATTGGSETAVHAGSGRIMDLALAFDPNAQFTPVGSDVTVQLGGNITLTFFGVLSAGVTSLEVSDTGPPPDAYFQVVPDGTWYNITTTATYASPIEICVGYDEGDVVDEASLMLIHWLASLGSFQIVSMKADVANNRLCGSVGSLSPFAIVQPDLAAESWFLQTPVGLGNSGDGEAAAWADYDGDGHQDVYVVVNDGANVLYRWDEMAGLYVGDISPPWGVIEPGTAAAWGDPDRDGFPDLLLHSASGSRVFRNLMGAGFQDVTPVGFLDGGVSAAWGDFDRDGLLDAISGTNLERAFAPNVFQDAEDCFGVSGGGGDQAYWGDFDFDGDLDLCLIADVDSRILRNQGPPDYDFVDITPPGFALEQIRAAAWGNYDNDDDLDLVTVGDQVSVWRWSSLQGWWSREFNDPGSSGGQGVVWADVDLDGDLDFYVAHAGVPGLGQSSLYLNLGASLFTDRIALGDFAAGGELVRSVTTVDHEPDGDLDFLLLTEAGPDRFFVNNIPRNGNTSVTVELVGTRSGAIPVGTTVVVASEHVNGIRAFSGAAGDGSQNPATLTIGLGSTTDPVDLTVHWASGEIGQLTAVIPGTSVQAVEPGVAGYPAAYEDATPPGLAGTPSSGAFWVDHDGDGDEGLVLTGTPSGLQFYDGFPAAPALVDLPGLSGALRTRAVWGDYDNDGFMDVYLVESNGQTGNRLLRADGLGSFLDVTTIALECAGYGPQSATWIDFDRDGDLDLHVVFNVNGGGPDRLFRNDGGDSFVNVAAGALADDNENLGGAAWCDFDRDGDEDVLLVNVYWGGGPRLLRNDGGDFTDVTPTEIADLGNTSVIHTGAAWGDYDRDGRPDFLIYGWNSIRLLRQTLTYPATFAEIDLSAIDVPRPRRADWIDHDNDGDLDIYVVAEGNAGTCDAGANRIFLNEGGGVFVPAAGPGAEASADVATGVAAGDLDGDGRLDLALAQPATGVLRNAQDNGNHWLRIRLVGTQSNRMGYGALVNVETGSQTYIFRTHRGQLAHASSLPTAQDAAVIHFGLGADPVADRIVIQWPSGIEQVLEDVPADQLLVVAESGQVSGAGLFIEDPGPAVGDVGEASGVAWVDYDNDGDQDIALAASGVDGRPLLLANDGEGGFAVDPSLALSAITDGRSLTWADVDNDGDLDVFVCSAGPIQLLRNNGFTYGERFTEATPASLDLVAYNVLCADYDLDGNVDIYAFSDHGRLFRNSGSWDFEDVTTPPLDIPMLSLGSFACGAWADKDLDGDPDLYVGGLGTRNYMLENQGGGVFLDVTTGDLEGGEGTVYTRSVSWGDYDLDGDPDLYLGQFQFGSRLLRNDHPGGFVNVSGTPADPVPQWAFDGDQVLATTWIDFDNDGDLDLYLGKDPSSSRLLRNDGPATGFTDVATGPLATMPGVRGAAWGHANGDSRPDLYVTSRNNPNRLLINDTGTGNSWLRLSLEGTSSNRQAVGALVTARAGSRSIVREVTGGTGRRSHDARELHFGLGQATLVDELEIRWPSGAVKTLTDVAASMRFSVVEDAPFVDMTLPLFGLVEPTHSIAAADYDGDGDDDLLVAIWRKASSWSNRLYENLGHFTFVDRSATSIITPTGNFTAALWGDRDDDGDLDAFLLRMYTSQLILTNQGGGSFDSWQNDGGYAYAGALVDYDGDGDLDVHLAASAPGNEILVNEGDTFQGYPNFVPLAHPVLGTVSSRQSVAWCDFDLDGDPDVFASSSLLGGNRLFENLGGGDFQDVTPAVMLASPADSRGAAWGDYDNDGYPDLYLASQAVTGGQLFRNDGGTFTDVTTPSLAVTGVHPAWADYDNDGDLDLYITRSDLNLLLENNGAGVFTVVTPGPHQTYEYSYSQGAAWVDLDGNGFLDLVVGGLQEGLSARQVLRNVLDNGNHWIQIDLTGTTSNRTAIGARVRLEAGGAVLTREVGGGSGMHAQDSHTLTFGLGDATTAEAVEVWWPYAAAPTQIGPLAADRRYFITQPIEAATPAGSEVEVALGTDVALQFDTVTEAGETAVSVSSVGPEPGALGVSTDPPSYYEISTTAMFEDSIDVCLAYDESALIVDEGDLRLMHYDDAGGGAWTDVTRSHDVVGDVICGRTGSLSPFLIASVDLTAAPEPEDGLVAFKVMPAYPNPFPGRTAFRFALPRASQVELKIYALNGRLVRTVLSRSLPAGWHTFHWTGKDDRGLRAATGVYLYRLTAGEHARTGRVVLLR